MESYCRWINYGTCNGSSCNQTNEHGEQYDPKNEPNDYLHFEL